MLHLFLLDEPGTSFNALAAYTFYRWLKEKSTGFRVLIFLMSPCLYSLMRLFCSSAEVQKR